jgi:hypothetical protein
METAPTDTEEAGVPNDATSTAPERLPEPRVRKQRFLRRIELAVLALFVLAGVIGMLGSKTDVVSATASGVTLTVTYPSVTRPGLPIRWEFDLHRDGGFDAPVELRTTFDYIHLFDISNFEPEPTSSTGTGTELIYVFDRPDGEDFRVSMDGNTEPGLHEVPTAETSFVENGAPVVSVEYLTVVVP